jgi:hypothetical protein
MKKTVSLVLVVLMVALLFASCSKKEPVLPAQFKESAEAAGMQVQDTTKSEANTAVDYIKTAYVAVHPDGWQVSYYEFNDITNTQQEFASFKAQIDAAIPNPTSTASVSVSSHGSYKITGDGKYLHLAFVGNTMVLGEADSDNADAMKTMLKDMGF